MRYSLFTAAIFAATSVWAHGNITWPPARLPGPAMLAACGQDAVNTVLGDGTIALEEVKPVSNRCNVGLCRGAQFEDNAANVQTFSLGQVVVVQVALTIPHEGPANVSIVQTSTNKIIGGILLFFNTYADERLAELPANNTAFGVTLPTGAAGDEVAQACRRPGDCVLQWWWFGTGAKQTYESCIDFVLAPAGPGGPNEGANQRVGQGGGGNRNQNGNGNGGSNGVGAGAGGGTVLAPAAPVPTPQIIPDVNDPALLSVTTEVEPAAVAEGSFGGVQGTISVDDTGAVAEAPSLDQSFGGVVGTTTARRRRSRAFRALM